MKKTGCRHAKWETKEIIRCGWDGSLRHKGHGCKGEKCPHYKATLKGKIKKWWRGY